MGDGHRGGGKNNMNSVSPSPLKIQGGLLTYSVPGKAPLSRPKRGCIEELSDPARRRLAKKFASLDWESYARDGVPILFCTLTTPPECWNDGRRVYMALRKFRRWLMRQSGFEGAIIRKERGAKNGMLHYHPVVFGCSWLPANEMRKVWTEALGCKSAVRVEVDKADDPVKVSKYLSKYISKAAYKGALRTEKPVGKRMFSRSENAAPDGSRAAAVMDTGKYTVEPVRPLSLSESHNVTEEAAGVGEEDEFGPDGIAVPDGYTGGRWWYVWGTLRVAPEIFLKSFHARSIAMRVRRIYRRILISRRIEGLIKKGFSESAARCEVKKWRRESGSFWWRGLLSRGFIVMGSPEVLEKCLSAAARSLNAKVEPCLAADIDLLPPEQFEEPNYKYDLSLAADMARTFF
jgi:hypothetical protein